MRGIWSNNFWHYCFIQSLSESDYDEIPTWGHDSSERKSEHRRRHLRLKIGPYIWNSFDAPAKVQEFSLNSIFVCWRNFRQRRLKKKYRLTFFFCSTTATMIFFFVSSNIFFSLSRKNLDFWIVFWWFCDVASIINIFVAADNRLNGHLQCFRQKKMKTAELKEKE